MVNTPRILMAPIAADNHRHATHLRLTRRTFAPQRTIAPAERADCPGGLKRVKRLRSRPTNRAKAAAEGEFARLGERLQMLRGAHGVLERFCDGIHGRGK